MQEPGGSFLPRCATRISRHYPHLLNRVAASVTFGAPDRVHFKNWFRLCRI